MNPKGKKFISLFLVFSLMAISCTTMTTQRQKRFESSKEQKHGAKLIITKKDGYETEGELITVKPNSLLLLSITGRDMSVGIADIKVIRVVGKSKALLGAGIGLIVCGGVGILSLHIALIQDPWKYAGTIGVLGAAAGILIGGMAGELLGIDKTIHFEGMTDSEIREALDKLRKKARIRDYK